MAGAILIAIRIHRGTRPGVGVVIGISVGSVHTETAKGNDACCERIVHVLVCHGRAGHVRLECGEELGARASRLAEQRAAGVSAADAKVRCSSSHAASGDKLLASSRRTRLLAWPRAPGCSANHACIEADAAAITSDCCPHAHSASSAGAHVETASCTALGSAAAAPRRRRTVGSAEEDNEGASAVGSSAAIENTALRAEARDCASRPLVCC